MARGGGACALLPRREGRSGGGQCPARPAPAAAAPAGGGSARSPPARLPRPLSPPLWQGLAGGWARPPPRRTGRGGTGRAGQEVAAVAVVAAGSGPTASFARSGKVGPRRDPARHNFKTFKSTLK
ncbi:uncharacterized protein FN964_002570 isoform 1-T1 [Alca torda]